MINNEERIKNMPASKYKEIFGIEKFAFERILKILNLNKTFNNPTNVGRNGKLSVLDCLVLFDDGNRIDLGIEIKEEAEKNYLDDKLTLLLLDKDNILPQIPPPTDADYHIKEPTKEQFLACCNNFWWCLNNVAKGIARDELSYVMNMLNDVVRSELHDMIGWYIGTQHGFNLSVGKSGKYFKRYLTPELYKQYADTYSSDDYNDIWAAVYAMCDLFHTLALSVAAHFGFTYRQNEEDGSREYLRMVKDNEC